MKQTVVKQLAAMAALTSMLCTATATFAAEERTLSLQEIISITVNNNGNLKALREEAGIGEAGRLKAGLYPNPVLELEGETGALTGSESENRVTIGVSQEFLTGNKREKRLAVADSELLKFASQVKDAERSLLLEVKSGFYDLLLAERRLGLVQKSGEFSRQLLQIARERFAAGDIAGLDVNLASVEAARSEGRRIAVEREIEPLRQQLLNLMGTPGAEDLTIAAPPSTPEVTVSLADLKALALAHRPDLQALASEKSRGEAELALALAERLPNVTAGLTFSRESTEISFRGMEDSSTDYLVGVNLSIPIPLFDRNQAAVKEARVRKSSAETRQSFVRQSIEREVAAAHGQLAAADKSLAIYDKEIIPLLSENLKLIQEAYQLGEAGILAVIEEQAKFIEVNEEYLAAEHSRNMARAKLEAAVGMELNEIAGGAR